MSITYSEFKEKLEKDQEYSKKFLDGTKALFKSVDQKKSIVPKIIKGYFIFTSFNTFLAQFTIGFRNFQILPSLLILIILKELFGLIFYIIPTINAIRKRPTPRVFDAMLDPFSEGGILSNIEIPEKFQKYKLSITSSIFAFSSLSNLRMILALGLCIYYNVDIPLIGHESELQKLGNLMILSFDLVLKTKNENSTLNIWYFFTLINSVFFLILGHIKQSSVLIQQSHWFRDVHDGKVDSNGIALGAAAIYLKIYGEPCDEALLSRFGANLKKENIKSDENENDKEKVE